MQLLDNYKDVLTTKELYEILPIGKNNVYKLLRDGTIKSVHVGSKYIIPKQNVIDFLLTV
jgi:excisionase family DNA binding protein